MNAVIPVLYQFCIMHLFFILIIQNEDYSIKPNDKIVWLMLNVKFYSNNISRLSLKQTDVSSTITVFMKCI